MNSRQHLESQHSENGACSYNSRAEKGPSHTPTPSLTPLQSREMWDSQPFSRRFPMGFFVLKRIILLNNFSNRILRRAEKFKGLHFKNNSKPQTGYFRTDNAFPLLWGKSLLQFHLRCPGKGNQAYFHSPWSPPLLIARFLSR